MDSVGILALVTGVAVVAASLWIWVPYILHRRRRDRELDRIVRRQEDWNWPYRMPRPKSEPRPVQRLGRLPETWDEYRR